MGFCPPGPHGSYRVSRGTQLFPYLGSDGSDSSFLVDRSGPMANEFWMSDRQSAALEPLIPMSRRA